MASKAARLEAALAKINAGLDELRTLNDEYQNWHDGMEGTNLESTGTYEALETILDTFDVLDDIDNATTELENLELPQAFRSN